MQAARAARRPTRRRTSGRAERARADREDEADDVHRDAVVVAHAHAQRRDHEVGAGRQVGDRVERRAPLDRELEAGGPRPVEEA